MLTLISSKNSFITRPALYSDWRDWFIIDDKPIVIHKTKLEIYIDKEYIGEEMIPINVKTFQARLHFSTDKDLFIKVVKFFIPEMGLVKEFDANRQMFAGDSIDFNGELFFFD